jgi:multidrug efflux system membrane fusion protein
MAGVAGLAAAVACGGKADPPADPPAPVRVAKAETGAVTEWVRLFGRVAPPPDRDATIAPQVAGVLLAVPVRDGQAVRAGEVVARVEPSALDDAVAAAEAAERRAASEAAFRKKAGQRTRSLFEKGVASGQEAEADDAATIAAESSLAEAQASLAIARRRRGWADLAAPFDGVVVKVIRRAGEPVDGSPASGVVQIAAERPVEVVADAVPEALGVIRSGAIAEIRVRDGSKDALPARVRRAARAVDPASGAGEVRLSLDDEAAPLVLGTPVSVRIAITERASVVTAASSAVRRGPGGETEVVVVDGGRASVRKVTIGITDGDKVEVVSGLRAGETVVIDDPVGLVDGTRVDVRP